MPRLRACSPASRDPVELSPVSRQVEGVGPDGEYTSRSAAYYPVPMKRALLSEAALGVLTAGIAVLQNHTTFGILGLRFGLDLLAEAARTHRTRPRWTCPCA